MIITCLISLTSKLFLSSATLVFFVSLIIIFYFYLTKNYRYWEIQGVEYEKPVPVFGTETQRYLLRRSIAQQATDVYFRHPKARYIGTYRGSTPELLIRDPDLIKCILSTDFTYFYERGLNSTRHIEPILRNVFFVEGDLWRALRRRLTPAFTSGKLKAMFPLVVERAVLLQEKAIKAAIEGGTVDIRDLMARYTTDFVGACGFGLDADSLRDDDSAFRQLGVRIFNNTLARALRAILKNLLPQIFGNIKVLGQDIEDEIVALVKSIHKQRGFKQSGRNDFIDLLMELRQQGKICVESLEHTKSNGTPEQFELELDDIYMAAQAFIFFAAGFETSSSATSATLHELAHNTDVQTKVYEEISSVLAKYNNKLSYEAIKEMTYLEWTFLEGMRMFAPVGFLMRKCVKSCELSDTGVRLEKGISLVIPAHALHHDPQYFPEPEIFRPERFSPEEVAKRHKFVFLPFGEGPRACIGARLGLMQSIAGLAAVLAKCEVIPVEGSPRTLKPDPRSNIVQSVIGGVPLMLKLRN